LLYAAGNFATAYAHGVTSFAVMRFVTGLGLGGELGAGIALITETMAPEDRTKGTAIVGFFGMLGVVFAGLIANVPSLSWRADYKIGGVLGLVVLVARFSSGESKMFQHMIVQGQADYWRILGFLFRGRNLLKLGYCILAGAPTFFIVGLLAPRSSQFGKALGMTVLPTGPTTLVWTYGGVALGGLVCGAFAQLVRSRKAALLVFHGITFAGFASLLLVPASDPFGLYCRFAVTGVGIGYWANMVTNAAEQWGTNVRGTVTIAVPNFVRLLLVPISFLFGWLEPKLGFTSAAWIVGIVCSVTAVASLRQLKDGFHRDLDFVENLNPNSAAAGLPVNI
jgi:MFS family permease